MLEHFTDTGVWELLANFAKAKFVYTTQCKHTVA